MNSPVWTKSIKASADPARVRHFLELLSATVAGSQLEAASPDEVNLIVALLAGSQAGGNVLVAHPEWLSTLRPEDLQFPRREPGLRTEVNRLLKSLIEAKDYEGALGRLREFKQREMLRIAARDLARLGKVPEITRELSDLADVCLSAVWQICWLQFTGRFGVPFYLDPSGWRPTQFSIIGLGKLGGQELNYSSDVDVVFVYSEEGQVFKSAPKSNASAQGVMANHAFFNRAAEAFIAEISRPAPEGMLFRIDLRLRPEGDAGPLCRSLASYENYYAQWGQTWERMMLIKARGVAGNASLAGEFMEMIQPFRYPRAVGENVLREIGAMKQRIENEVVRAGELDRNVKLGRGGIREIEFIAQSQQLLHAGKQPFLQGAQTLPALEKLAQYGLLPETETDVLDHAYCFLREVEHRLQMDEHLQTHTIPHEAAARKRLARLMGFRQETDFERARRSHSGKVRKSFNKLFQRDQEPGNDRLPADFDQSEADWKQLLGAHGFRDPESAFRRLREFVQGPGYVHVSPRIVELARALLPKFFALCPRKDAETSPADFQLSDPDRVVTRLDSFITAYGARPVLFELWNTHPSIFELLLKLFDRSEFLAELAIRTPDMVDELVTSGRLRRSKNSEATLEDLRHGLADRDQAAWLRRYQQVELMRIGLRDILGLADPEQYLTELSALADACLRYAVEVVTRKHKLKSPPFTIIGLGKLGGAEIDYGSDLDILFIADADAKRIRKLQPLALEIMDLLSARTESGIVFQTDARLRPDGEKGLLVNTFDAYAEYYRARAQLWEIQALTRARVVAGDLELGQRFQEFAGQLANFSNPTSRLAAFTPDWKSQIHRMRMRIERERTPAGQDELAIKTGKGGLMDAEFIAQTLCLAHGWHEANTLRALERGRDAGILPAGAQLIEHYRRLRRVEGILRRWSYEGETVLPDDAEAFHRVTVRCGFGDSERFRKALAESRGILRQGYEQVFLT